MLLGQDTPRDHLAVDKQNIDSQVECYLIHNGLVDILMER